MIVPVILSLCISQQNDGNLCGIAETMSFDLATRQANYSSSLPRLFHKEAGAFVDPPCAHAPDPLVPDFGELSNLLGEIDALLSLIHI